MFDPEIWARVPFQFWTLVLFVLGCVVGSFLNVCIYRMPRGESIVSPPSHCPHCNYSIPWYLNIPLVTWLVLRGRCANCGAPIAIRYLLVELLTGLLFAGCWLKYGALSAPVTLVYCLLISGLIIATFVDLEHFIIPDEISIGGVVAGIACSFFVPMLHSTFPSMQRLHSPGASLYVSFWGAGMGAGLVYGIMRLGKLLFGRQKIDLNPGSKVVFTETKLILPDQEFEYENVFYRNSDTIRLQAQRLELIDRCYVDTSVRLRPKQLFIGEEAFEPEEISYMEAFTDQVILPREAMGMGDVKFMAAIGAFLGWPAVIYSLAVSSFIGAIVGLSLIALKMRDRSSQMPYGPYIAVAAILWIFIGRDWLVHLLWG